MLGLLSAFPRALTAVSGHPSLVDMVQPSRSSAWLPGSHGLFAIVDRSAIRQKRKLDRFRLNTTDEIE
jgi:hypothetical protein